MRKLFAICCSVLAIVSGVSKMNFLSFNAKESTTNVCAENFNEDIIANKKSLTTKEFNIEIEAKAAFLMDYNSGTVVFSKNENLELPIASMCKIMTLLLCFEELDNKLFTLDDEIVVSATASGMGGSQVFLDANKPYKISELLKSIVVASANDASVAIAEHISGSEDLFTQKMNEKAKKLGMNNTVFVNATGLPQIGQHSSAKDAAIMFKALLRHKEYFKFSRIWMDEIHHDGGRITGISNTNKLIRFYEGCDSGKTGFTSEAGHCVTASAFRNGMRLISVIISAKDGKKRFNEASKLFNFGFANFENKLIVDDKKPLNLEVNIKSGKKDTISVIPSKSFYLFNVKNTKVSLDIDFVPCEKVKAPVKQGEVVGKLSIYKDSKLLEEIDVIANETVEKETYFDIIKNIINNWKF